MEPSHRRVLQFVEYQGRRRKVGETWGEVADDLRILADKAFPELNDQAKGQLTLDCFLSLLDNPKVAFAVRQQRPNTLENTVTCTLEIKTYLSLSSCDHVQMTTIQYATRANDL